MVSAVVLLYLTLGSSQAMKAAWWEDLLGLLPPAAFLLSDRFRDRDPTPHFPYGFHRVTSLAYLSAALALLALGGYILYHVGLWWADAAAAIVISLDIARDGVINVRAAAADLMDSRPTRYDDSATHPLIGDLEDELRDLDWVKDAPVRLREMGHVFVGEAFVVPVDDADPVTRIEGAAGRLVEVDWRLQEIVVTLVPHLEPLDASS